VKTAVNDGIDGQSVSIWGIHAFPRRLAMGGSKPTSQPGARFTEYLTAILRLSFNDNAKVTIDLRRTRLIYKTSHEGRKAFRFFSLAKL